ncbi:RNA binding protein [Acinetobacter baumannii]|uniref:ribosome assembly RNA-binding protein YhbY n=1 Tax=Acinetobacter baumannii TaxID=470 RepID=UPI000DE6DFAF|nr:ribosome assembly RNA-binding protein YhbY [Acinetobacter baumannii]MBV6573232.1 ribosome assembly RNA-binding protein YhbY [Acinetobacter baumannii]MCG6623964.1 ribosome assembly RNA-binding protein YhbY [Acinetobacter baumannii]MCY6387841.1 ribosome assembly RNA-binding protein YhbY [Acinetobacter baumannii]SSP16859.1 RNA binding protein [Acinetobacter baumannii]
MAALSIHERKRLRQIGHVLNPVVMIGGQGLTDAVIEETLRALNDHELIKVKIAGEDREARAAVIDAIVEATGAEAVQKIGKIVLLYKKAAKQNQNLSNLVRHAHLAN